MENSAWELTRELIMIDSSDPGAYEGQIGSWICNWFANKGIETEKDEVLPGRFNLKAELEGDDNLPAIVLICHMDTVMLGNDWDETHGPLSGSVEGNRLYGRGASDMKSGLACAMTAFASEFEKRRQKSDLCGKHRIIFIGTVDEEDFMRGSEKAILSGWVKKEDWILDTEPTDGQIQVAHKGRTWFEVSVQGITAHASMPWKGADAIAGMAEIISHIRKEINQCKPHEDLGISTVTFGQIEGGYRPYVVPDHAKVWIDMRLVPPTDTKKAELIVSESIKAAEKTIQGIKGSYMITGDRPYVEKDNDSLLLQAMEKTVFEVTGKKAVIGPFPGYTDTAVIAGKLGNKNTMSYGPGSLSLAHKPNEWVSFDDVARCVKVLEKLIS